jgi:hypothetical protein
MEDQQLRLGQNGRRNGPSEVAGSNFLYGTMIKRCLDTSAKLWLLSEAWQRRL